MFKRHECSGVSLLSALLAPGMACDSLLGQIQFGEPQGVLWRWGSATCLIHDVNADGLNDIVVGTSVYVNRGQGCSVENPAIGSDGAGVAAFNRS